MTKHDLCYTNAEIRYVSCLCIFDLNCYCYISDCKDTKIWMITRHGTRLPGAKDIIGMNTTLKDLKFEILLAHQQGKGVGNTSIL